MWNHHFIRSTSTLLASVSLITSGLPALAADQKPNTQPTAQKQTLSQLAQARQIYIGAAVRLNPLQDPKEPQYSKTLAREFNMLVPEWDLKMGSIQPERNRFEFKYADSIIDFALKNKMTPRGHTLLWHYHLPSWFTEGNFSRAELEKIMQQHIQTVVGRYKGKIKVWDVVNEAIEEDGTLRKTYQDEKGVKRDMPWNKINQRDQYEYIDKAFRWAHAADPSAKLYYNDYGTEWNPQKWQGIYNMVKTLKSRGVPIHGVGFQLHLSNRPDQKVIAAQFKQLADLGVEVEMTEVDVGVDNKNFPGTQQQKLQKQAQIYRETMQTCIKASNCNAFLMWGFTDKHSWVATPPNNSLNNAPLPFDVNYKPKPAYDALKQALLTTNRPK